MKKIQLLLFALFATIFGYSQNADDIIGKYHLPNKLDVEIYKVGNNNYNGKIIGLNGFENGQTTDIKNDDKTLRNKPLLGMVIIKGLQYNKETKEWTGGQMYGPEKGMFFDLRVTEMRENEIEVVGSKFLFWHTLTWKKI
jgi:uncharacterized protein (DUF2147 family)